MGGIGGPELLLVLLVVLVVFGPRRIPEIARGIGRGMREFQRLATEFQRELNIADALEEQKREKRDEKSHPADGANPAFRPRLEEHAPPLAPDPERREADSGGSETDRPSSEAP